ncbi:hypothetical protein L6164_036726 [Bauhinia variegata]|uniref:Uncharacterized protein n=1 Tax=Bauhinia variegata TaxID=167791 RepID=A0ACB9KI07_BAUVA|nr:hypothetical protein L6164_036726 [Bauhinia variegata]
MNILIAGTDSTAATSTWAMVELMKNPRVDRTREDMSRKSSNSKVWVERGKKSPKISLLLNDIARRLCGRQIAPSHSNFTKRHLQVADRAISPFGHFYFSNACLCQSAKRMPFESERNQMGDRVGVES